MTRVTKRYGRSTVLDDVTFSCPAGTVTAFCGPNGAGKSTALRVLAGVTRADAGSALVEGRPITELDAPAQAIGVLLDASAMHPGRTVRETLRLAAMTIGESSARADECVEIVGLGSVARRRVHGLSLGMRQRLGIAQALVGRPRILVLDEPSNGLDPDGIVWLDGLLRGFAEAGGCVLVSTHHLAAVERTADRVVALSRGRVVAECAMSELRATGASVVRTGSPNRLLAALRAHGDARLLDDGAISVALEPSVVGSLALQAGVALSMLVPAERGLESFLAEVTAPEFIGVGS